MTISYIAVYNFTNGEILWVTDMLPEEADAQVAALSSMNLDWVEAGDKIDTGTNWVVSGAVAERPVIAGFDTLAIAADDTDVATLDLEEPFTAVIDGVEYEVATGLLELASPMPASYTVVITHWPYQDFTATVVAT
jgi:hypothetical protein